MELEEFRSEKSETRTLSQVFQIFFDHEFLDVGEAALAADLITAA